jgi:D-xylose reductase
MVELCRILDMRITAYSSFGPQSFLELSHAGALETPSLLKSDVISKIAARRGKTSAQVLLRWATQRGIAVIPKSESRIPSPLIPRCWQWNLKGNNPGRAAENLLHTEFDLEKVDIEEINALNRGLRFNDPAGIDERLAIFA